MLTLLGSKLPEILEGQLKGMYLSSYRLIDYEPDTQILVIDYVLEKLGSIFVDRQIFGKDVEDRIEIVKSWNIALVDLTIKSIIHGLYLIVAQKTEYVDFPPRNGIAFHRVCTSRAYHMPDDPKTISHISVEKARSENDVKVAKDHLLEMRNILRAKGCRSMMTAI